MAGYVELFIDQGTDWNNIITLTDSRTNNVNNILGYSVRSKMRRSPYSANSIVIETSVSDPANGEITMSLSSANSANIKPGNYVFDVETISPDNKVSRVLEGLIIINPEATW